VADISVVCFDVGGVLTSSVAPAFLAQAQAAGLDPHAVKAVMWAAFAAEGDDDHPAHRLERGEIPLEEFFASVGEFEPVARILMDPASAHFVPRLFTPSEPMHALVREIAAAGLRTAIISNVATEWMSYWDAVLPVGHQWDALFHSCDVGLRKPNHNLYRHAMDHLGVEPGEVLYLDDFPAMAQAGRDIGFSVVEVHEHEPAVAEARAILGFT
jgi:epoxide hydrolase-like predicted phosphatase